MCFGRQCYLVKDLFCIQSRTFHHLTTFDWRDIAFRIWCSPCNSHWSKWPKTVSSVFAYSLQFHGNLWVEESIWQLMGIGSANGFLAISVKLFIQPIKTWTNVCTTSGPFYQHGLTLIPSWISNHTPSKLWDEITYPFLNFNGCTVEV